MGISGVSSSPRMQARMDLPLAGEAPPAPAAEPNAFEGSSEPAPIDLQGAPQGDWAATAASQGDLWPVAEADPVALQPAARPLPAIDPGKVGVVLNNNPAELPSGQELNDLGVTGARISLSGATEFGLTAGRDENGQPIYRAGASELQERIRQWNQPTGEAGVE